MDEQRSKVSVVTVGLMLPPGGVLISQHFRCGTVGRPPATTRGHGSGGDWIF